MGYYLEAFICKTTDSGYLTNTFGQAHAIALGQGLSLIPMTESLFDEIDDFSTSGGVGNFQYLTEHIENKILAITGNKSLAYVEAEYHGGKGGQIAIIWENNKRFRLFPYAQDSINLALQHFGVSAGGGQDEFSAIGLGLYRRTEDWASGMQ